MIKNNEDSFKQNLCLIKEGNILFYIHSEDKNEVPSKSMNVFYNKKMEINRDITNLAINAYSKLYDQKSLIVVDAMAASGVSSIRMIKECANIKKIYINDVNPEATKLINMNLETNDINEKSTEILVSQKDANFLLNETVQKYYENLNREKDSLNVISIDPFGTPSLYLDSAFKAIQRTNGLLCVSATDTAVLFGVRPDACLRKYMSKPLHNTYCKETGARILIHFISRIANINNLGIIPLLTFYANHFIRVFALTFKDKKKITNSIKKYGYILHCKKCSYRTIKREQLPSISFKCPLCGNFQKLDYAGPLWLEKIHNKAFIKEVIKINGNFSFSNKKRINKLLDIVLKEINMPISYHNIHKLSQQLKLPFVPKTTDVMNMIKKKGYKASRTQFDFLSIKTDMNVNGIRSCLKEMVIK